jgi:single-strand DNA-binding protein
MFLNKAMIIGNLTRDPEIKALPSGIKVCQLAIATNRVWKDKEGKRQEAADYHNVVVFGRTAELVAQYLRKGSSALVEGRLQTRSWDDKSTGEKKYRTEIVADTVQFGNRPGGAPAGGSAAGGKSGASKNEPADMPPSGAIEYPEEEINPDDIPF